MAGDYVIDTKAALSVVSGSNVSGIFGREFHEEVALTIVLN